MLCDKACQPAVEPLPGSADVAMVRAAPPSAKPADGPPWHAGAGRRGRCPNAERMGVKGRCPESECCK